MFRLSFVIPVLRKDNYWLFEVDNELQKAKYNHNNFSLAYLKANDKKAQLFLKDILKGNSTVLSGISYKHFQENEDSLKLILHSTDRNALQNIINNLKENLKSYSAENSLNASFSVYPEDAITSEELIENLQKNTFACLDL